MEKQDKILLAIKLICIVTLGLIVGIAIII